MAKTGRPLGRPPIYRAEERPVNVSLRIPRELYTQAERYRRMGHARGRRPQGKRWLGGGTAWAR